VPLLAGVAVAAAVQAVAGLDARLKWPNDVLVGDRKLAGILAEQSAGAIVAGAGINVSTSRAELPVETATSLVLEGAQRTDRQRLLCAVLAEFERMYLGWAGRPAADGSAADGSAADRSAADRSAADRSAADRSAASPVTTEPGDADACGLRAEYRRRCVTLGRRVRVEFPGGEAVRGTALDVDPDGRLVVGTAEGPLVVSAGDVVHLR
jgi:BirA family biotin operon repressor/biotin-[acetyl-CoA-carboxylase] ligase